MAEGNNNKSKLNPEMLVGVSAVIIGICALAVSLYETSLMREEQRSAVMPLLELSRSYNIQTDETSEYRSRLSIQAENVGIGPARVIDFQVTVDGVSQPTWDAAFRDLLSRESSISYGQSTINGRTIPPDRKVTMMELNDVQFTKEIIDKFDRLEFKACFCSIFEECWTTSYSTFGASKPVESCQRSGDSFLE